MRLAILSLSLIYCLNAFAAHVECFNNGKKVYDGNAKDVYYADNYIIFDELKTKKTFAIFGDCIIRFPN